MISRPIRRFVRQRAHHACEYCHLAQQAVPLARFHVEHIIPKQHGGSDAAENLCLSCARCNLSKGPNLVGIDSETGRLARLFHPRKQVWHRHFRWQGAVLVGLTKTGRATIAVLDINHPQRVTLRARWIEYQGPLA